MLAVSLCVLCFFVFSLDSELPEPRGGEDGQWVGAENWVTERAVCDFGVGNLHAR